MDKKRTPTSLQILNEHPSATLDTRPLQSCIEDILNRENLDFSYINVILTNHTQHRALNKTYLGHDYNTDVLAFPLHSPGSNQLEGEIYVDLDTARERHKEFNSRFETEVLRYVIHGLLHLAGYEDKTNQGQQQMKALEEKYLSSYS